ncbi:helix-turn-helix protein [Stackebrandtia albiflava]|uniref:Helix-turn-helix protein n=1 Tax=Stackebrandtia albiflava TaxID=406432 RepID=A0A562V3W6_9ACTN|nr:helix-turn-helix transcriptional regulator [Stackebrandtia albiflava]TWJ12507.1 helix-turn-helix protein [Stackebrandtia albiflava]
MATASTLRRRTLGRKLRLLRETAGIKVNDAADHIGLDRTTLQRWERGITAPNGGNIIALGNLYRATDAEISRMKTLATRSAERGIWESAEVPAELRALYEAEGTANLIRSLEMDYIPGLVQTPEYLSAAQSHLKLSEADAAKVHDVWKKRQAIVFRHPVPEIRLVFGQSALLYLNGLPEVKRGQVARLREVASTPGVEIRVMTGIHAAMTGAFTIMTADDLLDDPFVFLESLDGCRYVEERHVVSEFEWTFSAVWKSAVPLEEYLT